MGDNTLHYISDINIPPFEDQWLIKLYAEYLFQGSNIVQMMILPQFFWNCKTMNMMTVKLAPILRPSYTLW